MRKAIIIFVIILIFAVGGYFLYTMLFISTPSVGGVVGVTDTNFLTAVFSKEKFKDLKEFVPSPVLPGQTGKIDPFMKF